MKKRYYKITPEFEKRSCYVTEKDFDYTIKSWLDGMTIGYKLNVEMFEMTEEEFNKLPSYEI